LSASPDAERGLAATVSWLQQRLGPEAVARTPE
jgi:hypothetical protein